MPSLDRPAAHDSAPRLLVERIETEQLAAALDGVCERAVLFKHRYQTTEHLARALLEPLAVRLNPFVGAVRQQVAVIQRRRVPERWQISFKSSIRCPFERHQVDRR